MIRDVTTPPIPFMPTWLTACIANQYVQEDWLRDLQHQLGQTILQRGLPTRREEQWKYTDIQYLTQAAFTKSSLTKADVIPHSVQTKQLAEPAILLVVLNGQFVESLSDTRLLPTEVVVCSFRQALQQHAATVRQYFTTNLDVQRYPFANLNAALVSDGIFLHVPARVVVPHPIQLLYLTTEENHFMCPRNMIIVDEQAEVTVLEEHYAEATPQYFMNVVTDVHANAGATVHYHKIQQDSVNATHIAQLYFNQARDSRVHAVCLQVGARMAREDVAVNLHAEGAEITLHGFYALTQDQQHIDNHIHIDHAQPHGTSRLVYKGIIDKKSHAVFNGKIHVHKDAQKTHSYQANHNLLLSPYAAIDTKPELEIYADDVKCAHGDTVGQLDQAALFYLRSRGIDYATAMTLLTYAFAADILNAITVPLIKQRMTDLFHEIASNDSSTDAKTS